MTHFLLSEPSNYWSINKQWLRQAAINLWSSPYVCDSTACSAVARTGTAAAHRSSFYCSKDVFVCAVCDWWLFHEEASTGCCCCCCGCTWPSKQMTSDCVNNLPTSSGYSRLWWNADCIITQTIQIKCEIKHGVYEGGFRSILRMCWWWCQNIMMWVVR